MPIQYIAATNGTTTATIPAHQVGDTLIAFSFRDGSTTAPTVPAGWTTIASASGGSGSSCASAIAYKVATTTAETSGTWTNSTCLVIGIYRGCQTPTPIGGNNVGTGSSTSITYPSVTMQRLDGYSWIVGVAGHRSSNVTIETPPSGVGFTMTFRTAQANATAEAALHDTGRAVNGYIAGTASVGGTASNWIARTVELIELPRKRVFVCS